MIIQTHAETPEGGTPIAGADPVYLADPLLDASVRMLVELSALGGRARWSDPVADGFARISLGIEDTDDLISDFEQALS